MECIDKDLNQLPCVQVEEGWWEGSLNGKTGVFPSNFVEMMEDVEGEQVADGSKQASGTSGEKEKKHEASYLLTDI